MESEWVLHVIKYYWLNQLRKEYNHLQSQFLLIFNVKLHKNLTYNVTDPTASWHCVKAGLLTSLFRSML